MALHPLKGELAHQRAVLGGLHAWVAHVVQPLVHIAQALQGGTGQQAERSVVRQEGTCGGEKGGERKGITADLTSTCHVLLHLLAAP